MAPPPVAGALVAGVDSSTQSCKVVLCDAADGQVVGTGTAPHPATTPPRSEQDPEAWWAALEAAFGEAWEAATATAGAGGAGAAGRAAVAAISVAGQQHGLVGLDPAGRPVHPAKLWNDTESAPEAAALVEALGSEGWARACGSVPTAAFTITKLAWLRRRRPEAWARMARALLPHDWLTWRLLGRPAEAVTDRGDVSGTGWWSPRLGTVQAELLALVDPARDWTACLPRVLGPGEAAGVARVLAAPSAVVGPGTGDNMAAALALSLQPGDVAISLGTSGTVFSVSETPTADASGAVAGFADATGRFLPLVCTLNCTKVTDWVGRMIGTTAAELDRLVVAAPAGGGGVALVPYFDGERTPNLPEATGTLVGLRSSTSRAELARAAFEGVVCSLLDGLDALVAAGGPTGGRLIAVGGGARGLAYPQVLADLAQRPVEVGAVGTEWVALGAAVQAAAVLGGRRPEEVARDWASARAAGAGRAAATDSIVTPRIGPDAAAEVRAAYRRAAAMRPDPAGAAGPAGAAEAAKPS